MAPADLAMPSTGTALDDYSKRLLDIIVSVTLLVFLSPVCVLIVITIKITMGGPVLFRQLRPGKGEEQFLINKFRTMIPEGASSGTAATDAARLTRFGRVLRKSSLDELPQLLNVLRGEMSLVGPRPLLARYTPFLTQEERKRFLVRPGITGWAQIHGRNLVSWSKRLAMDVWYVDNRTLLLDLRILLSTVWQVLRRVEVVSDPHSIMLDLDEERERN